MMKCQGEPVYRVATHLKIIAVLITALSSSSSLSSFYLNKYKYTIDQELAYAAA